MTGINERFPPDTIPPTDYASALGIDQSGGGFDTVLMRANTYAVGLPEAPSPYRHLDQYVFTHHPMQPVDGGDVHGVRPRVTRSHSPFPLTRFR